MVPNPCILSSKGIGLSEEMFVRNMIKHISKQCQKNEEIPTTDNKRFFLLHWLVTLPPWDPLKFIHDYTIFCISSAQVIFLRLVGFLNLFFVFRMKKKEQIPKWNKYSLPSLDKIPLKFFLVRSKCHEIQMISQKCKRHSMGCQSNKMSRSKNNLFYNGQR